jgi:hypothetical protein
MCTLLAGHHRIRSPNVSFRPKADISLERSAKIATSRAVGNGVSLVTAERLMAPTSALVLQ